MASVWPPAESAESGEQPGSNEPLDDREPCARVTTTPRAEPATARIAAIARLGATRQPDALAALVRCLDDADPATRSAAARALASAGHEDALALLAARANDPLPARRAEALGALRLAPSLPPAAIQAAERALGDAEAAQRIAGVRILAQHTSPSSVPLVAGLLEDGVHDVRLAAIRMLAGARDQRAVLPLLQHLDRGDRVARAAVATALGQLGDARAGPALLRQLDEEGEDLRGAAADALGQLRLASATPVLARIARRNDAVGRRATLALGRIADDTAIATLVNLLRRSPHRSDVLDALQIAGPAATDALLAVLADGRGEAARGAIRVLGDVGDARAVEALARALDDGPGLAAELARALAAIGSAAAAPALARAALAPRHAAAPSVKQACVEALTALRDPRAADVVEEMAADPEPLVRLAALRLALQLGTGLSRAGLAARLADPDPEVRLQAIRVAPALKGVSPAPLLLARLEREPSFSREVAEALVVAAGAKDVASLLDALLAYPRRAAGERERILAALTHAVWADATPSAGERAPPAILRPADRALLLGELALGGPAAAHAAEVLGRWSAAERALLSPVVANWRSLAAGARGRLAVALAAAGNAEADQLLVQTLDADAEPSVRAAAAWAARRRAQAAPAVAEALARAARTAPEPIATNARAALAWAKSRDRRAGQALWIRLQNPDGTPGRGRWVYLKAATEALWLAADENGDVWLHDAPAGPHRLTARDGSLMQVDRPAER